MTTEEVLNYIREAKARGRSVDDIKTSLVSAGWKQADIEEALVKTGLASAPPSAPPPPQPAVSAERVSPQPVATKPGSDQEGPSWGTVGTGGGNAGDAITLPQVDTTKVAPKVSMSEVPPSASVMASVQPLDMGVQLSGSMPAVRGSRGLSGKLLMLVGVAVLLIGVAAGALAAYNYFFNNPLRIVASAVSKTLAADSFAVGVSLPGNKQLGNISGTVSYLKAADKLSKADFKVEDVGGDANKSLALSAILGGDEIFFKPSYSQVPQLVSWIKGGYPKLEELRTYQMMSPVFQSDSWFDAKLPKGLLSAEAIKGALGIDASNERLLQDNFVKSLVVRRFETTNVGGGSYYRVVLGFNKGDLVDLLGQLPGSGDQSSMVGKIEKAVGAVSSWNDDLVEILVDKSTGYLASVTVSLPEELRNVVTGDLSGVKIGGLPVGLVAGYLPGKAGEQLIYLGKLTFSGYGGEVTGSRPTNTIDFGTAVEVAKVELLPILSGYLTKSPLPDPFEINIDEAKRLWGVGDYRDSLTQAGNMIGMATTNAQKAAVHYWIGAASYKLGDLAAAEKEELMATSLDQKSGVPYAVLALVEIDKKDYQKAYAYAVKGVALEAGSAWTHNSLGLALLNLNRRVEAVAELKKAVALSSGSAEIQANLDKALASPSPTSLPMPKPSSSPKPATSSAITASPTPTASASGFPL